MAVGSQIRRPPDRLYRFPNTRFSAIMAWRAKELERYARGQQRARQLLRSFLVCGPWRRAISCGRCIARAPGWCIGLIGGSPPEGPTS